MKRVWVWMALLALCVGCVGCSHENNAHKKDGFSFTSARDGTQYVLNASSRKIHLPTCAYAARIAPENKVLTSDLNQAKKEEYTCCQQCMTTTNDEQ